MGKGGTCFLPLTYSASICCPVGGIIGSVSVLFIKAVCADQGHVRLLRRVMTHCPSGGVMVCKRCGPCCGGPMS